MESCSIAESLLAEERKIERRGKEWGDRHREQINKYTTQQATQQPDTEKAHDNAQSNFSEHSCPRSGKVVAQYVFDIDTLI